jgi:hypothetical protein
MKKRSRLTCIFILFIAMQAYAQDRNDHTGLQPKIMLSVIAGISPPKKTLEYGPGIGIKGGISLNKFYVGMMACRHSGDERQIKYGSVPALGIPSGLQNYKWRSYFLVADAGYQIGLLTKESISLELIPYVTTGLGVIDMSTSGVYGSGDNVVDKRFRFGAGALYNVRFGDHFSVGIEYRMYAPADASFRFSGGSKHGFSTGIYYDAFFSVVSYRL